MKKAIASFLLMITIFSAIPLVSSSWVSGGSADSVEQFRKKIIILEREGLATLARDFKDEASLDRFRENAIYTNGYVSCQTQQLLDTFPVCIAESARESVGLVQDTFKSVIENHKKLLCIIAELKENLVAQNEAEKKDRLAKTLDLARRSEGAQIRAICAQITIEQEQRTQKENTQRQVDELKKLEPKVLGLLVNHLGNVEVFIKQVESILQGFSDYRLPSYPVDVGKSLSSVSELILKTCRFVANNHKSLLHTLTKLDLHAAVKAGATRDVRALIQAGLDVNQRAGDMGATPLYEAVSKGDEYAIRLLLDAEADPNIPLQKHCDRGQTVLFRAIHEQHPQAVRMLIAAGANLETPDSKNKTPLMVAASVNCPEIVKILLERGAQLPTEDQKGLLLYCAVQLIDRVNKQVALERLTSEKPKTRRRSF